MNCPRCGGRLARDNDSGRCTPCQTAERSRLSAPPEVPASFWDHEPLRQALAERHLGQVIRAYRHHPYHGRAALPQAVVGNWLGITQAQLSRIENGPRMVHLDRLEHWATLLRIPESGLWFRLPAQPEKAAADVSARQSPPDEVGASGGFRTTLEPASDEGGGITNRRRFNTLAALAGLGGSGLLDDLLKANRADESLGMEHVRLAGSLVERLRQTDAAVGSGELCDVAMDVHARLSSWAAGARFSRGLGEALQSAQANLANQVAWLAIDAERRQHARPYLNDAITRARIADDPRDEVRAMACLSLLTREDQPSESLHCAEAALRASQGWATPRLNTLLRLRMAHAYANLGDVGAFNREMARAHREFDRGPHEDDLPFLQFVNTDEMTGIQGLSFLALGRPARAAESFRLDCDDPGTIHRRNQILRTVQLSEAEYRCGDIQQAAQTGLGVLPAVKELNSKRTERRFAQVKARLAGERSPAAREFVDAYNETFQK
ncbi:hypothetical protein GCM10011608_02540 [Micromonospora sonchi]|uniref:HTH cro/C1-type domain-containing protein n=1 Tax=Micromonospora sonchi TaxID=1763543 RepID=A0A917TGC9_9ACTN|nr:hypothetical protein GCM10011608_02540 [Micromonospora sonchi]